MASLRLPAAVKEPGLVIWCTLQLFCSPVRYSGTLIYMRQIYWSLILGEQNNSFVDTSQEESSTFPVQANVNEKLIPLIR